MKNLLLILVILSLIFVSCKKEPLVEEEEVSTKTFDIRGSWELVEANMYFVLETTGGSTLRKSNHFLGGNTESFLQDASKGEVLPIEYIVKNSIWTFRNSSVHIDKLDGSIDTISLDKRHTYPDIYPNFDYQTNPTTCMSWDSQVVSSKCDAVGDYGYENRAFFTHTIGTYGEEIGAHRGIEMIIHRAQDGSVNRISLLMTKGNMPNYFNDGSYVVGQFFNELVLEKR